MERRFEELERRASRGAAPFARPESKRSPSPKRPGRKGGHVGACRIRPPEETVDRRIEAPLTVSPMEPMVRKHRMGYNLRTMRPHT
jgi:hypothetical protein